MSERDYDLRMHGRPDVWIAIDGFRQRHARTDEALVDAGWADGPRSMEPGPDSPFGR